jgi:hypothetical protein
MFCLTVDFRLLQALNCMQASFATVRQSWQTLQPLME